VLAGAVVLLLLLVGAAALLLRSLDRPWVKTRVQALVQGQAGVEIDYRAARGRLLGGLTLDGLVVRSPARFRAVAPLLLRVAHLEVAWSRASLLGRGPRVDGVSARGIELSVVRDERDGVSSLELAVGPPAPPSPPGPPFSRLLATRLDGAPPLGRLRLEDVRVTLLRVDGGRTVEGWRLAGLAVEVHVEPDGRGWRVDAALGRPGTPLALELSRERAGQPAGRARARLALSAEVTAAHAALRLALDLDEQTLHAGPSVAKLVELAARARFADGRVAIELTHLAAADGAIDAAGTLALPDEGAARVEKASGAADLVRLLAFMPEGLVPARARRASLSYRVEGLLLSAPPRLDARGIVELDAKLDGVSATLGGASLLADRGSVVLRGTPGRGGALALHARVPLGRSSLSRGRQKVAVEGLSLAADGTLRPDGTFDGRAGLEAAALDLTGGPTAGLRSVKLALDADALQIARDPLRSRGRLHLDGGAEAASFSQPGTRLFADGAAWQLEARLSGAPPYAVTLTLPLARLRVWGAGARPLVDGKALLELAARQIQPDLAHPLRSRAALDATVQLDALSAKVKAQKLPDAIDYDLTAAAKSLAALALLAGGEAGQVPWERVGLELGSKGRLEGLRAPSLRHDTQLALARPAFRAGKRTLAAQRAALTLRSSGTLRRHGGDAGLRLVALEIDGKPQGDSALDARFAFDMAAPSATLSLDARGGEKGPAARATLALAFDRAARALGFDVDLHAEKLGVIEPLLAPIEAAAGFQLSRLALDLRGKGTARGLVERVEANGAPRFATDPLKTLGVDGAIELGAAGVRWRHRDRRIEVPRVGWKGRLRHDGAHRALHGELDLAGLIVTAGQHRLEIEGVRDSLDLGVDGDLRAGDVDVSQTLSLASLRQDFVPGYPAGDVAVTLKASRDADGVVRLDALKLENRAAASTLAASGGLDLAGGRRGLSLRATLEQDLARAFTVRQRFTGKGRVVLTLQVDSGTLRLYHAAAALRIEDGHVELPRNGVKIERIAGEVPLVADIAVGKRVRLIREAEVNAYSELRFADQHPLLSRRSFLSVGRITTPLGEAGPLAGNLRVEQNIVSLSQLEMSLNDGRVTGRCLVDWGKEDTRLHLQLRASRVEASRGEPFDGNVAVVISSENRSVEGRAEILRIGRRHLLDLLDLHDPYHRDAAVNRVRRALALGYPDRVRMDFDHGFASARITFGGLARLVRIDPIRGIPMGPIIDKVLAPLVEEEPEEE
jgi:hypothetical protein